MKKTGVLTILVALAFAATSAPAASPPSNDDRDNASKILGTPAASAVNFADATASPGEDTSCSGTHTVWYAWRAKTAEPLTVWTQSQFPGGGGATGIRIYQKVRSTMLPIACGSATLTFTPQAGAHYLFQIGGSDSDPFTNIHWNHTFSRGGLSMNDAVNVVAPPFPFSEIVGIAGSVSGQPQPSCAVAEGSYWYAFTASSAGVYDVHLDAIVPSYVQVYNADGSQMIGGCRATLEPHAGSDVLVGLLAGQKIFVQYGHNVDPAARQTGDLALGFFTLAPAA